MKRMASAISLLSVVLGLGVSLTSCGEETETVSAATISALPFGKTFEIDLTHKDFLGKGTVYKFGDAGTDFSRVTIRTAAGVKAFADLLKGTDTSLRGGLVLGTPDDMRYHLPTPTDGGTTTGGWTTRHDCGSDVCKCNDKTDCLGMILKGKCASPGEFWCSTDTSACYCVAKQ
jgi:hypothetical protein